MPIDMQMLSARLASDTPQVNEDAQCASAISLVNTVSTNYFHHDLQRIGPVALSFLIGSMPSPIDAQVVKVGPTPLQQ